MTSFLGAEIIGSGDRAKAACSRHGEARTKAASADASVLCIPVRASGGWRLSSGARMLAPRSTSLALLGPVGWRHDRVISVSSPQSQKSNHFFVHSPGQDASGRPLPVSMGRNLISKTCWGFDETRARADETADRPMRQAHLSNRGHDRGPWKSRGRKSHSQRSLSLAQNPNFALKIERGQVCGAANVQ